MKNGKKLLLVALVLLIVIAIILLLGFKIIGPVAGKPYVVGAFCSVSGPNAPLGTPERDTLLMLEEEINQSGRY